MSTKKHLIITGISNISWKDATLKAINEVSKTIDYISEIKILEQKAKIEKNKISEYYVDQKTPNSPIFKNCFNAFWVGGLICTIGQLINIYCKSQGLDAQISSTIVSIILIGISAFLTGLNCFNKIGKFAGAGSLIPITGFANSIVSPAMEYKSAGYVMGVGAKMFTVAGPAQMCQSILEEPVFPALP